MSASTDYRRLFELVMNQNFTRSVMAWATTFGYGNPDYEAERIADRYGLRFYRDGANVAFWTKATRSTKPAMLIVSRGYVKAQGDAQVVAYHGSVTVQLFETKELYGDMAGASEATELRAEPEGSAL